jgi:uncharacterized protein (TIGR02300 family)
MASKAERGTKRTCQNNACGARFYDLLREPIACPVCSTKYVLPVASAAAIAAAEVAAQRRAARNKPEFATVVADPEAPEIEVDDTLADVEAAEETIAAGDEETFLEPEEDEGGDVSGIIVGNAPEGEEEP